MFSVSHGIDIVEIKRISEVYKKFNRKFLNRILTYKEVSTIINPTLNNNEMIKVLSGRYACKEATAKAIGTGFSNGLRFTDFEIINNKMGQPILIVSEKVKRIIKREFVSSVSISHEKKFAIASVIFYYPENK